MISDCVALAIFGIRVVSVVWYSQYNSAQMSVRIPVVMPAKAGIQGLFLDSRQEHAGMTTGARDTSFCCAVLRTLRSEEELCHCARQRAVNVYPPIAA